MPRMKGLIAICPALVVSCLAACGGGAPPTAPASSSPSASLSAAAPPASAKPASAAASTAPGAKPAALDKITLSYTAATSDQLPSMIAKDRGFFEQNGLDVDIVAIGSGSNPQAAALSGQIQVFQGASEVVPADLAGADLAYIASPSTAFSFWLFSVPSITNPADLKGKQVAVTGLGSSTHTAARLGLRQLGLDPEKDVVITAVNNPPAIFAAMQSGAVQAASIGPSNIVQAREAGWHELIDLDKAGVVYPAGWPIVSHKYADAHQDVIMRFTKGLVQGIAFMIKQPQESQAILGKWAKNDNAAYLKANYDLAAPHLQKAPHPSLEGVRNVIDQVSLTTPEAKGQDPAKFVDDRYVRALEDNGFIASLYK
jgi:ABC-type nitrate/sulfonate/bicarbonate transport system substrate-binding protein